MARPPAQTKGNKPGRKKKTLWDRAFDASDKFWRGNMLAASLWLKGYHAGRRDEREIRSKK